MTEVDHEPIDPAAAHTAEPEQVEPAVAAGQSAPVGGTSGVPETGDIVVDAALAELAGTEPGDLDGQLTAGESLQRTLQARLADLGG